jgi:hypothetical protein
MQIKGIANKVMFKGLKAKALECMEAIARERGQRASRRVRFASMPRSEPPSAGSASRRTSLRPLSSSPLPTPRGSLAKRWSSLAEFDKRSPDAQPSALLDQICA